MNKLTLILLTLLTNSAFAQVSDSLITKMSCVMGYGESDTYYQLEVQQQKTGLAMYIAEFKVSDGERKLIKFTPVVRDNGPTGITTYVNKNNTYQVRILKQNRKIEARVSDSKSNPNSYIFEECVKH